MCYLLEVTHGHLSNMHKYRTSLTFNYFNSEALRQSKRLRESLIFSLNLKSIDWISIYFKASELKKSFLKRSPYLYMSPSEWYGVINLSNSSYLC